MKLPQGVSVIENSWRAKIAGRVLKADSVAIVFGKKIHLYGATEAEFLQNARWVKHELKHVEQYQRYGYMGFITRYLLESIRNGYNRNKYEIEAWEAEDSK